MKVSIRNTVSFHTFEDGDCARPEENHFKKRRNKRWDRKKILRKIIKNLNKVDYDK